MNVRPPTRPRSWCILLLAAVFTTLVPRILPAGTAPETLRYSADVTVELATYVLDDHGLAEDDLAGAVTVIDVGSIPAATDLDAWHLLADGDQLLSFDTTVELPGSLAAGPADVVRFDGASYGIELAAADLGLLAGVNVDALTVIDGGDLLLSFDTGLELAGQSFDDADLVRVEGAILTLFFDGDAAGVPPELDVDAVHHVDDDGRLLLSFDGSGIIGVVSFDDEDVLDYDPATGAWTLLYDGSALHPEWTAADLDALHAAFPTLATEIFADGFESGDLSAWSSAAGARRSTATMTAATSPAIN